MSATTQTVTCNRCGGGQIIPNYKHVAGGVCFECNGAGTVEVSTASLKSQASRREASAKKAAASREAAIARVSERNAIQARIQPALEARFGSQSQAIGAYRFSDLCAVAAKTWNGDANDLKEIERLITA